MNLPMLLTPKVSTTYLMAESPLRDALDKFHHAGYNAVPVLWEDGRYRGAVSSTNFLTYILENGLSAVSAPSVRLTDIMGQDAYPPVSIDSPVTELLDRVMDANFVPVVDDRDCFVGIVTRKKVLSYLQSFIK